MSKYVAKHAKFKVKTRHKAAVAAALGAGAIGGSVVLSGSAHAATMDQWNTVAQCESGGDWSIDHGDGGDGSPGTGASAWGGGLQFQPASWDAALGYLSSRGLDLSHFGTHASNSTKDQQILAAEALLHIQPGHPDPWACDPNQNLGASMFDGGPNPWAIDGYSGDTVPQFVLDGTLPGAPAPDPTPAPPAPDPAPVPDPTPVPVTPSHHNGYHGKHARKGWATGHGNYTVVKGDCLWSIAPDHDWQKLYAANKATVGDNPDLIHPGQKLVVE